MVRHKPSRRWYRATALLTAGVLFFLAACGRGKEADSVSVVPNRSDAVQETVAPVDGQATPVDVQATPVPTAATTEMGRYVEETWMPPDPAYPAVDAIGADATGAVEVATRDGLFRSADGAIWDKIDAPWLYIESLDPETGVPNRVPLNLRYTAFDASGRRVIVYERFEGGIETIVARVRDDGTLEEIPIEWHVLRYEDESVTPVPTQQTAQATAFGENGGAIPSESFAGWDDVIPQASGLAISASGDILIGDHGCGVVRYGADGRFVAAYPGGMGFAVCGNTLLMQTRGDPWAGTCDAMTVDLTTGQTKVFPFPSDAAEEAFSALFAAHGDRAYMACATGVYRLRAADAGWDRVIDGALGTLASPSTLILGFAALPSEAFVFATNANASPQLLYYRYDPNLSPYSAELRVHSLIDNPSARVVASAFMKQYPDLRVTVTHDFQYAGEIDAATLSQAVQALRGELAAGTGPDVLLLDGMSVASFARSGALLDLSSMVETHTASGEWLPNIARAFEWEGRVYAIPARFTFDRLIGRQGEIAQVRTLKGFSDFVQARPGMHVLYDMRPESLFYRFIGASLPSLVDADGVLDRAGFAAFLGEIGRMSTAGNGVSSSPMLESLQGMEGVVQMSGTVQSVLENEGYAALLDGTAAFAAGTVSSAWDLALQEAVRSVFPDGAAIPLSNRDGSPTFTPLEIYAVNARSPHIESATRFIALALGADMQRLDLYSGLPTHFSALQAPEGTTDASVFALTDAVSISVPALVDAQYDAVRGFVATLSVASAFDQSMCEAIAQDCKPYFEGTITADEAARRVAERLESFFA